MKRRTGTGKIVLELRDGRADEALRRLEEIEHHMEKAWDDVQSALTRIERRVRALEDERRPPAGHGG